jgi:hypothetical protein
MSSFLGFCTYATVFQTETSVCPYSKRPSIHCYFMDLKLKNVENGPKDETTLIEPYPPWPRPN